MDLEALSSESASINTYGKFIIFVLSTALINGTYDTVIAHADKDFSAYDNSLLFQGSILRLKALAIQSKYDLLVSDDQEEKDKDD